MSLTSFLKRPEVIQLFRRLPKIEPHLVECKGPLSQPNRLAVPRYQGANPALIGTAYDFWCRAFIQRINGQLIEKEMSQQVQLGLGNIRRSGKLKGTRLQEFESLIHDIWTYRVNYINGEDTPVSTLANQAIQLAYVEQAYRSGKVHDDYFLQPRVEDVQDLCNLIRTTTQGQRLLKTDQIIYMNPTFGFYSFMVGGADADFVFGTTLVDIKTTVHKKGFQDYFQQLFGYYLLSEFDKTFVEPLQNLAVYLPRFDSLYYVRIDVLRGLIDIDAFAKEFLSLAEEYNVHD